MSRASKGKRSSVSTTQAALTLLTKLDDELQVGLRCLGDDLFEPVCPLDGGPLTEDGDGLEAQCACGYRRRLHPRPCKIDIVAVALDSLAIRFRNYKRPAKPTPKKR